MQVGFGPGPDGRFHPNVVKFLYKFGDWLKVNGEGIYATRPRDDGQWKDGDNIYYTRSKDNRYVYAIVTKWPGKTLSLQTMKPKVNSNVTMLGYDKPLHWQVDDTLHINIPDQLQEPQNRPCEHAWVFRIEQD